jgi:hypothetical protein
MIPPEKELWRRRYEQLRQQVLEPDAMLAQDRWGLGLLLRKGLAGWMRLWQDPAATAQQVAPALPLPLTGPAPGWQPQATLLLANMAFSHFHPCTTQRL